MLTRMLYNTAESRSDLSHREECEKRDSHRRTAGRTFERRLLCRLRNLSLILAIRRFPLLVLDL